MINLFNPSPAEAEKPGFRMRRLEVYNWGTFDGAVWPFELGGDTSLLTGEIGSGKSTLVDAILTLLIPQPKINYNKAADAGAKERSLNSYVRGYYAKRVNENGAEEPVALRGKDSYSVLLAVFTDQVASQSVTLAQVFYFTAGSEKPSRFFVVAQKPLSIRQDFGNFGTNISDLKKRLRKTMYTSVYNDYTSYAEKFKSLFGITQDNALDLFQQTVSMKKVNGITDFVRRNMLGDVDQEDMQHNIDQLLSRFQDLKSIHDAILKDQQKMEILAPLTAASDAYDRCLRKEAELDLMGEGVMPYLAGEEAKVLAEEISKEEAKKRELDSRMASLTDEMDHVTADIENKQKEIWENGGSRLDSAEKDLAACEKDLQRVTGEAQQYEALARELGLALPDSLETFLARRKELEQVLHDMRAAYDRLDAKKSEADSHERDLVEKMAADRDELESLQKRDSNIPADFVAIRKKLCQDLVVPESDMPFAGEIMEVKPTEAKWEGALERLLSEFGVSLLVPESLYEKVITWMESHFLGRRIVYYRVEDYTPRVSLLDLPEQAAARKLNIKRDSPYAAWLTSELAHRFDHICAETPAEFRKASFALSLQGQIKARGKWHKKDDRFRIDDRRHYVLGFSNKEKIKLITKELADLTREREAARAEVEKLRKERDTYISKRNAAETLLRWTNFKDIDTAFFADQVKRQKKLIADLKRNSNILARLTREVEELKKQRDTVSSAANDCRRAMGAVERTLQDYADRKQRAEERKNAAPAIIREKAFALLEAHKDDIIGKKGFFTLKSIPDRPGQYTGWVNKQKKENGEEKTKQADSITAAMTGYLQYLTTHNESDPNLTTELNTANRNEYKEIYRRIKEDDLPRLLPKFKKRLRENTIQDMAIFQSKLFSARDAIRERIGEINRSLYDIDYNPGHYIEIECVETLNNEIKQFRQDLKASTDSAMSGSDDTYNEEKFLQIEKILDRFSMSRVGHAEEDQKWTRMVTDVRNWFTFAVSERIRKEDGSRGEEFEHYTDSSGKSGGQKEKLAYTILAASFVYSFGIAGSGRLPTFRFTAIDEAFLKSSDESARFGLELFKKMGLQLLVVTPLAKIPTIEPYISHLGYVSQNEKRQSEIRNMTIGEYRKEFAAHEKKDL